MSQTPLMDDVLQAIRDAAEALGRAPSRSEFRARSGITDYHVLRHFANWNDAVRAAGWQPNESNLPIEAVDLWRDWSDFVRRHRRIPTRNQYRREGSYHPNTYEKKFGPWSTLPEHFRAWAGADPEWADVVALLPRPRADAGVDGDGGPAPPLAPPSAVRNARLADRPTYGNPIDFRGLRHEPVNEQGVVFLFGVVARELGYLVEAIQTGYPDCEAKRQVEAGKWQRVRIEFEYESRNFRDHGHPPAGCDVIVCWRHNWSDCPPDLEVVELSSVIAELSSAE